MIKRKPHAGVLMVLFAALLWSSNAPFVRWISLDPITVAGIRSLIAGFVLLPFLRPRKIHINRYFCGFFLCFAALTIGIILALRTTSSAIALSMQYTSCLWLFLLSKPTKKELSIQRTWPILTILLGIVIFMFSKAEGITLLGNLIAISTSFSFSGMTYFAKKMNSENPIGLASLSNLLLSVILLAIAHPSIDRLTTIPSVEWWVLLYLGIFQIGISYALYYSGLRTTSATTASLLCPLEMIMGPIWTAIFLEEYPDIIAVIGFVIVLSGIIGEALLSSKHQKGS